MFEEYFTDDTGWILAIMGSGFSLVGALVNNIFLLHTEAMWFWTISNPLLLAILIIGTPLVLWLIDTGRLKNGTDTDR